MVGLMIRRNRSKPRFVRLAASVLARWNLQSGYRAEKLPCFVRAVSHSEPTYVSTNLYNDMTNLHWRH